MSGPRHLEYPQIPFHAFLERAAKLRPDATALVLGERQLTFAEWNRQASQLAHALIDLGVERGDRIALYTPNCIEYEVAFFAACRAGAVPTPLNPSYKERELRYQLADSGARVLIVHGSLYPVLEPIHAEFGSQLHVITIGASSTNDFLGWDDALRGRPTTSPEVAIGPEDLAALPYSSGTTGVSKGVMLTQRNLVCNALQYADATATTERDVLLVFLPLFHIYGVALMATALAAGARQVLMERFNLPHVLRLVEKENVSELYVVPPVMLALANAPDLRREQFRGLRFAMSAAAPLAVDVTKRVVERLGIRVIQAYGMTEASPLTHMVPLDRLDFPVESVGMVVADTHCRIVDLETGEIERGPGEVGEVTIAGPQVMAGYWNAPEDTARTLRNGWLHTGDVGKMDAAGNLHIVDRKKEMIKYKAFSIAPAELESLLLEHPAVEDCAVVGQPDLEAGEVPRAFVVLRAGQTVTAEELRDFVRERVAGYKQIRAVELVEAIPRTPSGKILRRVLKEQARAATAPLLG